MATSARASTVHVDQLLFGVRWALLVIVLPLAWIDSGGTPFSSNVLIWLLAYAAINLIFGAILSLSRLLTTYLPALGLVFDTFSLVVLVLQIDSKYNLLAFILIFPAVVGAIRFGPTIGLVLASICALAIGTHVMMPTSHGPSRDWVPYLPPVVGLFISAWFTGYLAQREKEAVVAVATAELQELRRAMAGAKMFFETTDSLSVTTSYTPVLENMLEAGIKGLPTARNEDGTPVGLVLFFDEGNDKRLRIVAARNVDQRDRQVWVRGQSGIVAEALRMAKSFIFDDIRKDPELVAFGSLRHCRSGVCYPLQAGMDQYGVVILAAPAPRRPTKHYLDLIQAFTNQAGIAIQNAKLYQTSRQEQDRIINDENEMRRKLARDLHDGPTQKVAGLVMQLDYIRRLLDRDPAEAKIELEKAHATAQQTVKEIRTTLFTLRPLALESKGLSAALEQFGQRLRDTEKVPIQVVAGNIGGDLDQNIAVTIFAIIEEAVGNARKHAANAPIYVSASQQNNSILVSVQDEGPGFDVAQVESSYDKRTSLGMQNMRERAQLIDGKLTIDSALGQGTRVTLIVPLPPPGFIEKKS